MTSIHQTHLVTDPTIYTQHRMAIEVDESPDRVVVVHEALKPLALKVLNPRKATEQDILRCHTKEYFELVKSDIEDVIAKGEMDDGYMTLSTGDTPVCPDSLDVALWAVGGVLTAVDAVMQGVAKNVFCNIRPPGHHATSEEGMGFCIFNNVALGAEYAREVYGVNRVLIVDWDVHHGNGTEEIFENNRSVCYFSTYQKGIFPITEENPQDKVEEAMMTFPIEKGNDSRRQVLDVFKNTLTRKMEAFKPELVMISAGFDAREGDPMGGMNLQDRDFVELTHVMKEIADKYAKGRIVSVLEGGYDLDGIASAALAHVKTLNQN